MKFRVFVLTAGLLSAGLVGCTHDCKVQTMRCNGNKVELCYPDHKWKVVVSCDQLSRTTREWRCVKLNESRAVCKPTVPQ